MCQWYAVELYWNSNEDPMLAGQLREWRVVTVEAGADDIIDATYRRTCWPTRDLAEESLANALALYGIAN